MLVLEDDSHLTWMHKFNPYTQLLVVEENSLPPSTSRQT
jgi:hypothetical protein